MDGGFNPEGTLTRAMLVTVLHRIEGEPIAPDTSFTDVPGNSWFYGSIAWAHNLGIVNGRTETTFAPDAPITRQEVATILKRYVESYGYDSKDDGKYDLSKYPDATKVAGWALDAMGWAVDIGLINGSDGKLVPEGKATRAQIAAILNRFCENILADKFQSDSDKAMAAYAETVKAYNGGNGWFYLVYIDADQIPELVCASGGRPTDQPNVYTWYNGRVCDLGVFGQFGTLPYAPRENSFGFYNKPMMIVQGFAYEAHNKDTSNYVELYYESMYKINQKNIDKYLLGK